MHFSELDERSTMLGRLTMADNLEEQIWSCKKRIEIVRNLIEEQWANGLSTDEAERVLAQELSFLKILNEQLGAEESVKDC
jgi:hypothetical protein